MCACVFVEFEACQSSFLCRNRDNIAILLVVVIVLALVHVFKSLGKGVVDEAASSADDAASVAMNYDVMSVVPAILLCALILLIILYLIRRRRRASSDSSSSLTMPTEDSSRDDDNGEGSEDDDYNSEADGNYSGMEKVVTVEKRGGDGDF